MGHPQEAVFDAMRMDRDRLRERHGKLEKRLRPISLSEFTFEQFADLQLVADRSAASKRAHDLEQALGRLEQFLELRAARKSRKR